jgi:hypothetical protein
MSRLLVRPAHNRADHYAAHALVESTYQCLDYIRGPLAPLAGRGAVLLCLRGSEVLGTATLLPAPPHGRTETELEFGHDLTSHLPPGTGREQVVEFKRFVKQLAPAAAGPDTVLLALMLAAIRHSLARGYTGWVATLKPDLVRTFQRLGMPLVETARQPLLPACLNLLNGSYYTAPGQQPCSVYCDLEASAEALRRFEVLLLRGSITLDVSVEVPAEAALAEAC